ncbi:IS5 family transposase [Alkalibacter rhizosphaerae]|uniref:IS5 family transposase n=1 Tax=Alkalibacter rhizosphaerae TaxID=2815577 RepID=A0A975AIV9_9FIRM|nr:IS5 family transposase [Alkalibacter rhizosphaerae]QSX09518.1 IS5 family transposase [Alkalibacter rhizosphaerae]
MYRSSDRSQPGFLDFNQPLGLKMNPNNRWVTMANQIPWEKFEEKYAGLFPSDTGNVAKPLRMALGSLIIQIKYGFSDRELVEQLTENPYYQYFIGLSGYRETAPFDASLLVSFRKRISAEMLMEANEYIIAAASSNDDNNSDDSGSGSDEPLDKQGAAEKPVNKGTLILDATCAPSNIRYPQDFSLLNEAREKLEAMIDRICKDHGICKPRTYRQEARKNYLALAKTKKRSKSKIRKTIRKQLGYVKRDLRYIDDFLEGGYALTEKEKPLLRTIRLLYEQQDYMFKNHTHSVENRIVSIQQPYLRPIVRGKVKTPVEFGAKFDLSVDEMGYARIEKLSFDPYNESTCLQKAVENYKSRTGHYPERVLVDQIYRTRANREYCKDKGVRLSGPKLGRPSKNHEHDKAIEYQDNVDRIEVERAFSLSKRCYGLGLIKTKLKETTTATIALSVLATNLFRIQLRLFFRLLF